MSGVDGYEEGVGKHQPSGRRCLDRISFHNFEWLRTRTSGMANRGTLAQYTPRYRNVSGEYHLAAARAAQPRRRQSGLGSISKLHFPICAFGQQRPSDKDLHRAGQPAPFLGGKSPIIGPRLKGGGLLAAACATGGSAACEPQGEQQPRHPGVRARRQRLSTSHLVPAILRQLPSRRPGRRARLSVPRSELA